VHVHLGRSFADVALPLLGRRAVAFERGRDRFTEGPITEIEAEAEAEAERDAAGDAPAARSPGIGS
jgi:hypothetical protein